MTAKAGNFSGNADIYKNDLPLVLRAMFAFHDPFSFSVFHLAIITISQETCPPIRSTATLVRTVPFA